MSVTNCKVLCTDCDFSGAMIHKPVTLIYQLPDGTTLSMGRYFGWCDICDSVVNMEPSFDADQISHEVVELDNRTKTANYRFKQLINRALGGQATEVDDLPSLRQMLKVALARKSKPRCLQCGSEDVNPLDNALHKCGGKLYIASADKDAPRLSYAPEIIYLDYEGNNVGQLDLLGRAANLANKVTIEDVIEAGRFSGFLIFIPFQKSDLEEIFTTQSALLRFCRIIELRIMHLDFDSVLLHASITDFPQNLKKSANDSVRAVISAGDVPIAKWYQSQLK